MEMSKNLTELFDEALRLQKEAEDAAARAKALASDAEAKLERGADQLAKSIFRHWPRPLVEKMTSKLAHLLDWRIE